MAHLVCGEVSRRADVVPCKPCQDFHQATDKSIIRAARSCAKRKAGGDCCAYNEMTSKYSGFAANQARVFVGEYGWVRGGNADDEGLLARERTYSVGPNGATDDWLEHGRAYKMLTVLDEYTREALCVSVRTRMSANDVLEALYPVILER